MQTGLVAGALLLLAALASGSLTTEPVRRLLKALVPAQEHRCVPPGAH